MQKEVKTEITKEKLIAAASKLIDGCDDPFKVTSRQIAEESGMQAAMINYCFGSRESLIYEVFHRKYKEALTDKLVFSIVYVFYYIALIPLVIKIVGRYEKQEEQQEEK